MLLILMYHRVGTGKHSNTQSMLFHHLTFCSQNFPIVVPGEELDVDKLSICLTFDDATFDFYHYVYPMLQHLNIRAVLSIPVKYISNDTSVDINKRLSVPYYTSMKDKVYKTQEPFCTWKEILIMVKSGLVYPASHSYSHMNLSYSDDINSEIVLSKKILESKLSTEISTFVYPYGRTSKKIHNIVSNHYSFIMKIGSAVNKSWTPFSRLLFRVPADNLTYYKHPLDNLNRYYYKYYFSQFKQFCTKWTRKLLH